MKLQFAVLLTCAIKVTTALTGVLEACSQLRSINSENTLDGSSPNYDAESKNYWDQRSDASPACIFFPENAGEVAAAVKILGATRAQFAVRGNGGLTYPGSNNIENGVLIALGRMKELTLDIEDSTLSVGPGNQWIDVYEILAPQGMYAIGGRIKYIGVSGLSLLGGINYFINKYGWTMDTVVQYDVVLGNGTQVTANKDTHSDLFWALKGGGSNFGIVTGFVYQVYDIPTISVTTQVFNDSSTDKFVEALCDFASSSNPSIGAGPVVTMTYNITSKEFTSVMYGVQEGHETPPSRFSKFASVPPMTEENNVTTPFEWHDSLDIGQQDARGRIMFGHHTIRATEVERVKELVRGFKKAVEDISDVEGLAPGFVLNTLPGSAFRIAKENGVGNVYGMNDDSSYILWQLTTAWLNPGDDLRIAAWSNKFLDYHHAVNKDLGAASELLHANYATEWQNPFSAIPFENIQRLRAVRESYDPEHIFTELNWGGPKLWG